MMVMQETRILYNRQDISNSISKTIVQQWENTKHKQFKNNKEREKVRTMISITGCNLDTNKPTSSEGGHWKSQILDKSDREKKINVSSLFT